MVKKEEAPYPANLGRNLSLGDPKRTTEPVGHLGDYVGHEFRLKGLDGSGAEVEWIVRPTGANSFELVVPKEHELGHPESWDNVSIMTQRVICRSGSCGCDGNQCACQGNNCGSQSTKIRARINLISEVAFDLTRVEEIRNQLNPPESR